MKQIKCLNGKPAYECKSWKDLDEALGKCSVPVILGASFNSEEGLYLITVADDLVHNVEDYNWANVPIECPQCGWKGLVKDLVYDEKVDKDKWGTEKGKCPICHEELF